MCPIEHDPTLLPVTPECDDLTIRLRSLRGIALRTLETSRIEGYDDVTEVTEQNIAQTGLVPESQVSVLHPSTFLSSEEANALKVVPSSSVDKVVKKRNVSRLSFVGAGLTLTAFLGLGLSYEGVDSTKASRQEDGNGVEAPIAQKEVFPNLEINELKRTFAKEAIEKKRVEALVYQKSTAAADAARKQTEQAKNVVINNLEGQNQQLGEQIQNLSNSLAWAKKELRQAQRQLKSEARQRVQDVNSIDQNLDTTRARIIELEQQLRTAITKKQAAEQATAARVSRQKAEDARILQAEKRRYAREIEAVRTMAYLAGIKAGKAAARK